METKWTGKSRTELLKMPDSELTPEERLYLYGKGNTSRMLYAIVEKGGKRLLVNREFKADEETPEGWVDSPAKLGYESHPDNRPKAITDFEAVVAELPPEKSDPGGQTVVHELPPKAKKKAANTEE